MIKQIWRDVVAPALVARLAPLVASAVRSDLLGTAPLAAASGDRPQADPPPGDVTARVGALQVFRGYEAADLALFAAFADADRRAEPDFIVDFLGARTRASMLYDALHPLAGSLQALPIPDDYHAECVEWLGLLKSARTARGRYVAMEWGAGWGPWLVAGARAARLRGIDRVKLVGVEADPLHVATMRQHFADNGILAHEYEILQAAVAPSAGMARWPKDPDPRNTWGTRPVRSGTADTGDEDYLRGRVDEFLDVEMLSASELLLRERAWDLIHIDIQGWEGEVCRSCIAHLNDRARWVVAGVHSRIQDAALLELFHANGWHLEHEKPTHFRYDRSRTTFESMVTADGTQVWRNPRLVA